MNNKQNRGENMTKAEKQKKVVFFVSGFIVVGVETVFVNAINAVGKFYKSHKDVMWYNHYKFMKSSIANMLSAEFEGLPTIALESIAMGIPCITANCESGPQEILLSGKEGLVFENSTSNIW